MRGCLHSGITGWTRSIATLESPRYVMTRCDDVNLVLLSERDIRMSVCVCGVVHVTFLAAAAEYTSNKVVCRYGMLRMSSGCTLNRR